MSIVRFDPFRDMDRLQNEVNRLFEGYLTTNGGAPAERGGAALTQNGRIWSPTVDILDNPNEIVLHAEIPGMKLEEIDIELTGDTLTLRGERKALNEERKDNFVRVERSYGRFQRSFTLGVPVQNDKVSAQYRDGILEIRLPKSEATKPRKVQVTNGHSASQPQTISAGQPETAPTA